MRNDGKNCDILISIYISMCVVFSFARQFVRMNAIVLLRVCLCVGRKKIVFHLSLHMLFSIYDATLNAQHPGKLHFYFSAAAQHHLIQQRVFSISISVVLSRSHFHIRVCVYIPRVRVNHLKRRKSFEQRFHFHAKLIGFAGETDESESERKKKKQSLSTQIANALTHSLLLLTTTTATTDVRYQKIYTIYL